MRCFRLVLLLLMCPALVAGQAQWAGSHWNNDVYVIDYGAVCNGATNDAAAIQAAINAAAPTGGTVVFPPRRCAIATTLTVGAPTGTTATNISLRGSSPVTSIITWTGATNVPAVQLKSNRYFRIQDLGILNTSSKGTTVGLLFTGYGGVGTETFGGVLDHVLVQNFHIGIQAGDDVVGVSASDMTYNFIELSGNDYGWVLEQLNTLNHVFTGLNLVGNGIGVYANIGNLFVRGGSTSGNATADFMIGSVDIVTIRDMRAETTLGRFVVLGYMSGEAQIVPNVATIEGNQTSSAPSDGIVVEVLGGKNVTITNNMFSGQVATAVDGLPRLLTMSGNIVKSADAVSPLTFATPTSDNTVQSRAVFRSNWRTDSSLGFPDAEGTVVKGDTHGVTTKFTSDRYITEATFGSAATVGVTFSRTVTVTATGSVFALSSGSVRLSDLNRRVVYTPSGGTQQTGLITAVNTGSNQWTVNSYGGPIGCGSCTTMSVVVGRDEMDANFLPIISCNAQETVSWSAKATTGLTLTSSNATSTAICNVMIER